MYSVYKKFEEMATFFVFLLEFLYHVRAKPIFPGVLALRSFRLNFLVGLAGLLISANAFAQQEPAANVPMTVANRPFTPGLGVGDTLYLSGHLGFDPATGKPPADAGEEAKLVMQTVEKTLHEAGMTMDDLVSVEIYCTDLTLYSTFNKVYVSFFHKPYPARAFIGVKDLLFGTHFEVMGIAVRHAAENKKPSTSFVR